MNLAAAVNETFANYSNYLIYSAMAVYTLAFLAHIAEWIFGGRSKVARTSAAADGVADGRRPTGGPGRHRQPGATAAPPCWTARRSSPATPSGDRGVATARAPRAATSRATCTGGSPSR